MADEMACLGRTGHVGDKTRAGPNAPSTLPLVASPYLRRFRQDYHGWPESIIQPSPGFSWARVGFQQE